MPQVKHCVLLRFQPQVTSATVATLFGELSALKSRLPGILDFTGGPYSSQEGLNKGFTHGFVMTFADEKSRDIYLDHPEHEVVKNKIFPNLDGALDGVVAFDYLA